MAFTGSSYLTTTASGTMFNPSNISICFWAYISGNGWSQIISTQTNTVGWMLQVSNANKLFVFISNTQPEIFQFGTTGNPSYNTWFHVTMVLTTAYNLQSRFDTFRN